MSESAPKTNPLIAYFKGAWQELQKVTWPTRQDAWRKTWVVIFFSLGFAVFLGIIDYLLNQLLDRIV